MTRRKKRPSNNPAGRPSQGLGEKRLLLAGPTELLDAMAARAESQGIAVSEAWRRAARTWLEHGALTPEDVADLEG